MDKNGTLSKTHFPNHGGYLMLYDYAIESYLKDDNLRKALELIERYKAPENQLHINSFIRILR